MQYNVFNSWYVKNVDDTYHEEENVMQIIILKIIDTSFGNKICTCIKTIA